MNLVQFGLVLRERWRIVAVMGLVGLLLALVWIFVLPKHYDGVAEVLVNIRAPDTVTTAGDNGVVPQIQPDYLATQADVIRSQRVAIGAVKRLGLTEDPQAMQQYRNSGSTVRPDLFFAANISRALKIVPTGTSRVISIIYTAADPSAAASVANAFALAYQDTSIALQAEPEKQASQWYDQALADLAKRLADAQGKLSTARAQLGVTGMSDQPDADDARLVAMSQQLALAQATQAAQNQRTSNGALPDATLSPVVQGLRSDLARLEAQRRQLSTFAGPNNVDYQQLTRQEEELRSQLASEEAQIAKSAAASSSQSTAAVNALTASVAAQRERVIKAQKVRGEVAALEQTVNNLRATYEALTAKQSQSQILSASNQTNVSILSPATPPTSPSGLPWLLKLIGLPLLFLIFGTGLAIALEFLDQRMRTPEDAQIWLGIPSLGGIRNVELTHSPRLLGYARRYLPRPGENSL